MQVQHLTISRWRLMTEVLARNASIDSSFLCCFGSDGGIYVDQLTAHLVVSPEASGSECLIIGNED